MKHITIAFVAILLFCSPVMSQEKCLRKFFRQQKGMAFGLKVGVGSFPLKMASWFIPAQDSETVVLKHLLSHVHHVKVYALSSENATAVTNADIDALKQILQTKEKYEPLVDVRQGTSFVHVLNKGKDDELGNVIMLVQDENDFVIVHLRTTLQLKDVNGLIQQFAKN